MDRHEVLGFEMAKTERILFIYETGYDPEKIFQNQVPKLAKGLTRLGRDARVFNYTDVLSMISPCRNRKVRSLLYKVRVDKLLAEFIQTYEPDIIHTSFPRLFDSTTLQRVRQAAPNAVLIGSDGDPWPAQHVERIATARGLDILTATNDGEWLQEYRQAGVPACFFLPNTCDPDIDHRYEVSDRWKADILWIGKLGHRANQDEQLRKELVLELAKRADCTVYGCCGRPKIGGRDFLYAVSGARIGVSVNAYGPVKLAHSDRLTRFLAGGAFVLARRFPGCDRLYQDGQHLRYFDSIDEFFELAKWYLAHEDERQRIADAGMKWVHKQFSGTRVAQCVLDLVEKGRYAAPWTEG